jgi:hypothetical protein
MIDLSKYNEVKNRVTGVGIELEGAWDKLPKGMTDITRDGSLDVWRHPPTAMHKGEIPSPVLKVGDQVKDWLTTFYPTYSNHERCGMHVHLSVADNFRYQQLMSPEYMDTALFYLTEWAKDEGFGLTHWIWRRLNGEIEYCKKVFDADAQVRARAKDFDHHREGNRYTAMNYPWARFRTVECRVLPMMNDAEQANRAVSKLIDITNKFLCATARIERAQTISMNLDPSPEIRESIVVI